MTLSTYLRILLYGSALFVLGSSWLIISNDPTAGHGELIERIRHRNSELQRQIDAL